MYNDDRGRKKFQNEKKKLDRDALNDQRENMKDLRISKSKSSPSHEVKLHRKWQPSDAPDYSTLLICGMRSVVIDDVDLTKEVIALLNSIVVKRVKSSEIKTCQRTYMSDKVEIEFNTVERGNEVFEKRNEIRDPYIFGNGEAATIYIVQVFSPLASKLAYFARQLKRKNKIFKLYIDDGNVKIKINKSDRWIQMNRIDDFYELFPSFKFSEDEPKTLEGNLEGTESGFDGILAADDWKTPDHSVLEISGIGTEIDEEHLKNEVLTLLNNAVLDEVVTADEIKSCLRYRSGKVIVGFTSMERGHEVYTQRNMLVNTPYTNGRANKSKIFINKHLSRCVGELAYHARKMKRDKLITGYETGDVKIRIGVDYDDDWIEIKMMDDFRNHFPDYEF